MPSGTVSIYDNTSDLPLLIRLDFRDTDIFCTGFRVIQDLSHTYSSFLTYYSLSPLQLCGLLGFSCAKGHGLQKKLSSK